jgi:hypothetical protein
MAETEIAFEVDGEPDGLAFWAKTDWTFAQLRAHAKEEEGVTTDGTAFVVMRGKKKVTVNRKQEGKQKWANYYTDTVTMQTVRQADPGSDRIKGSTANTPPHPPTSTPDAGSKGISGGISERGLFFCFLRLLLDFMPNAVLIPLCKRLWDEKYPQYPWTNDTHSGTLFQHGSGVEQSSRLPGTIQTGTFTPKSGVVNWRKAATTEDLTNELAKGDTIQMDPHRIDQHAEATTTLDLAGKLLAGDATQIG